MIWMAPWRLATFAWASGVAPILEVDGAQLHSARGPSLGNETGPLRKVQDSKAMDDSSFHTLIGSVLTPDAQDNHGDLVFIIAGLLFFAVTGFGMVILHYDFERADQPSRHTLIRSTSSLRQDERKPMPFLQRSVMPEALLPRSSDLAYGVQGSNILAGGSAAGRRRVDIPGVFADFLKKPAVPVFRGTEDLPLHRSGSNLPSLCPGMVLPTGEARFAVDWGSLHQRDEFELAGPSGRSLLRCRAQGRPLSTHELIITTCVTGGHVLGMAALSGGPDGPYLIRGPTGEQYGSMVATDHGCFRLIFEKTGEEVLTMATDAVTGQLTLCRRDGSFFAAACRSGYNSSIPDAQDCLEVRVASGCDSILAMCCLLGALLFGRVALTPGDTRLASAA